jgi:N6-L-threonylcarbamoyladenine synthase
VGVVTAAPPDDDIREASGASATFDESTLVLGIETSCDETAAALVLGGYDVVSSVVSTQVELHADFGGVVPEIASRAHLDVLNPVIARAIVEAGVEEERIDAVACTVGPGLIGALLVGVSAAKALAMAWDVPFVGVNHMEAHLYAASLEDPTLEFPLLVLLVSGGHTMLVEMQDHGRYRLVGQTIDDAAGEAFDKVARFLDLGYPGGPAIDRAALDGDPEAIRFPRAIMDEGYDFSFSGLKTAVVNYVRKHPDVSSQDVAASFQAAVVDVLVSKARRAAKEIGATGIVLGGGVAANTLLRTELLDACEADGIQGFLPSRAMCTDNAAMIAAAGWHRLRSDGPTPLDVGAVPNLRLSFCVRSGLTAGRSAPRVVGPTPARRWRRVPVRSRYRGGPCRSGSASSSCRLPWCSPRWRASPTRPSGRCADRSHRGWSTSTRW